MFLYGLATRIWLRAPPLAAAVIRLTLLIATLRLLVRMACSARIYGPLFALGAPVRTVYGNVLNSAATVRAVAHFAVARVSGRPLKWLKTDHNFPSRATLLAHKRKLGEILVGSGYLTAAAFRAAFATKPPDVRLGEHLIRIGALDDFSVYEALSLQQGLPVTKLGAEEVSPTTARALPEHIAREWRVLPFRIAEGRLYLATPELPSVEMTTAVRPFTSLELRIHLMTPAKFEKLTRALL